MDWCALAITNHKFSRYLDAASCSLHLAVFNKSLPQNCALHSDLSPQGGATECHADLQVFKRLGSRVSKAKHKRFAA